MATIYGLLGFALFALACTLWERCKQKAFERRFPPISDAEFMARCKPGTNPDVALRVRRIVSRALGIDYDRIYPSSRFVDDLDTY